MKWLIYPVTYDNASILADALKTDVLGESLRSQILPHASFLFLCETILKTLRFMTT